ncbi:uncharacterized protein LOC120077305 [Benincasa hispida]|uniref:uncharacterized protein LOC120077305 n=1 Tax=Benincasa hispida TaxID=102211 RepID=UPI0019005CF4|nr:uncharacterized protein LOC120077305 [Benincasa hispida]
MTIGGSLGVGLHLPGIGIGGGISIGGGFGLGSGGADEPPKSVPVPTDDPSIQELGKFAVEEFNIKYNDNLKFQSVYKYEKFVLDPYATNYNLWLTAIDCLKRLLNFKARVAEVKVDGTIQLTLESFDPVDT